MRALRRRLRRRHLRLGRLAPEAGRAVGRRHHRDHVVHVALRDLVAHLEAHAAQVGRVDVALALLVEELPADLEGVELLAALCADALGARRLRHVVREDAH